MRNKVLTPRQLDIIADLIFDNWDCRLFCFEIELCMNEQGWCYWKEIRNPALYGGKGK